MNEDSIYIDKIRNGNLNAYNFLVNKYKKMAYTISLKITHNHEDAEEAAMDGFYKAFKAIDRFNEKEASFSTWLYKIVMNCAISKTRKKKSQVVDISEEFIENEADDFNIIDKINLEQQEQYINKAIDKLKENEYIVTILYYYEEKSVAEIEEITEFKQSNIKILLFRSRNKIKVELERLLDQEIKV
jgi:RNA polymerase sigma-70 factor (ECF subfamily)